MNSDLRNKLKDPIREGCDVNVPISEVDLDFIESDGEVSKSGSGKEPEEDEDGDAGSTCGQDGNQRRRGRRGKDSDVWRGGVPSSSSDCACN